MAMAGLSGMVGAVGAASAAAPSNEWSTKLFTCDGMPGSHWAYAIFCPLCAAAHAKSISERSNPVFNFFCFTPLGNYSYVRNTYNIIGDCGGDLFNACLCMPCGVRQLWSESKQIGEVPGCHTDKTATGTWTTELFQCEPTEFCMAFVCPCVIAHKVRLILQPATEKEPCFNYLCLIPTSMYGQVRHIVGIGSEWPHPTCEDLFVGLFCYPCALARANREAMAWKIKRMGTNVANRVTEKAKNAVSGLKDKFTGIMK